MAKEKRLTISDGLEVRGTANSDLGLVISYLQRSSMNKLSAARASLVSRFLPFALDQSDPDYRATALRCANECESWARAIREFSGLPSASAGVHYAPLVTSVTPAPVISDSEAVGAKELPVIDSDEDLLNRFEQELQSIIDSADGARDALKSLVKLKPYQEEDWTEEKWDLWEEYSDQQQSIIKKQELGNLFVG